MFSAYGHRNVLATHRSTFMFTRDADLTRRGDCIIGTKSDFFCDESLRSLSGKIRMVLEVDGLKEEVFAEYNPSFASNRELVVRKSSFKCERTFATNASKSAFEIDRKIIEMMKQNKRMNVTVENV
ncbi:MAG: DUF371 domain-containing protein [Candidatus Woesearchaeota archaeon]